MATKTTCNVSRTEFVENAKPMTVLIVERLTGAEIDELRKLLGSKVVGMQTMIPKQFSTDSLGWNASTKVDVNVIPSAPTSCQMGLNLTLVGSKELPKANGTNGTH